MKEGMRKNKWRHALPHVRPSGLFPQPMRSRNAAGNVQARLGHRCELQFLWWLSGSKALSARRDMLKGMSKQDWGIDVGGNSYGGSAVRTFFLVRTFRFSKARCRVTSCFDVQSGQGHMMCRKAICHITRRGSFVLGQIKAEGGPKPEARAAQQHASSNMPPHSDRLD